MKEFARGRAKGEGNYEKTFATRKTSVCPMEKVFEGREGGHGSRDGRSVRKRNFFLPRMGVPLCRYEDMLLNLQACNCILCIYIPQ